MTQPEALRLADLLEQIDGQHWQVQDSAAAELRRLYAELERCKQVCAVTSEGWRTDAEKWKAQRDALLEALKRLMGGTTTMQDAMEAAKQARAAIKAAEENT